MLSDEEEEEATMSMSEIIKAVYKQWRLYKSKVSKPGRNTLHLSSIYQNHELYLHRLWKTPSSHLSRHHCLYTIVDVTFHNIK